MNLKDAFRFQNKLQSLMDEARSVLCRDQNITKVQNTYLRKKVMLRQRMKPSRICLQPSAARNSPKWQSS